MWAVENDLISVLLVGFDLVSCVVIGNDLFFASRTKLTGFVCQGIENDLPFEWGSKLTRIVVEVNPVSL